MGVAALPSREPSPTGPDSAAPGRLPSPPSGSEVTRLLASRGGRDSERLLELVYDELRRLASAQMRREDPGHTLQPTALVHEAWLRLVGAGERTFDGRVHFFRAAALAMRRILIDRARRSARPKHGGEHERVPLPPDTPAAREVPAGVDLELADLAEALEQLEAVDAQLCDIVSLRWLSGLSVEETAEALGRSTRSIKRDWSVARAWLADRLNRTSE